jgi:hypothetical protein
LIRLDIQARDSRNDAILQHVDKVKRLVADEQKANCSLLAALLMAQKSPPRDESSIAVFFYNPLGDARALYLSDRSRKVIGGGIIDPLGLGDVRLPCGTVTLIVHTHVATPREGIVDGNEVEIRSSIADVAFVEIADKDERRRDAIPVTSSEAVFPNAGKR